MKNCIYKPVFGLFLLFNFQIDSALTFSSRLSKLLCWGNKVYQNRLKASCATNSYLLDFYWKLGRDIEAKQYANTYGSGFYKNLSQDLKNEMPGVKGFSPINLRYMSKFFKLYAPLYRNIPQTAELFSDSLSDSNVPQVAEQSKKRQQPVDDFKMLLSIPWDHHRRIIDKCKDDMNKALFFVRKTWENNWGRDALLNWLDTDLYERDGKAVTNFQSTLSAMQSDLAQQMTKDPYQFDFLNLREKFDERDIEDELVNNVTRFLLELGKGFSYMGWQFRLEVGQQEFFPDLLFYNAHLHAYVVIELKAQSFHPSFLGQLSFYVSAINHQFKTDIDNPTIGLLICKDKDNVVAKYALESYKEPMGISEYQLSKLFPKNFKSSMPTIEELEKGLKDNQK